MSAPWRTNNDSDIERWIDQYVRNDESMIVFHERKRKRGISVLTSDVGFYVGCFTYVAPLSLSQTLISAFPSNPLNAMQFSALSLSDN